jgi:hypothetical protein
MAKAKFKGKTGFAAVQAKAQASGYSKESAQKIAAAVGRKKYGAKGMAKKAAAGRKKAK